MFVSEWLVWYYKHADSNSVKKSLKLTGINYSKNVNEQVALLCMVLYLIFFSNFVSNKIFTFDDRDPPWMPEYIKSKFQCKNGIHNKYMNGSRNYAD